MSNSLALLANEPPPRQVGPRYSRLIRCYSFQEILFEYCICLLLLVSVALVIFGVSFLRSKIRGGICSGDCTDVILVSLRVLWLFKSPWKYTAVEELAHEWRWNSSAIIWLCWETKRKAAHVYSTYQFKEMEKRSTVDLYGGKKRTQQHLNNGIFWLKVRAELIATKNVTFQSYFLLISICWWTPGCSLMKN